MSDLLDFLRQSPVVLPPWYVDLFCGDVHLASYHYHKTHPDIAFVPVPEKLTQGDLFHVEHIESVNR